MDRGSRFGTGQGQGKIRRARQRLSVETAGDKLKILPTAALDWHPDRNFSAFFRYQQGFRSGGLAATVTGSPDDTQEFRSEEHTSELQSLMRISYAVFCLKKKKKQKKK